MPHRQNLRFLHCIAVRNAYACTLNSSSSPKVHFVGAFWEPYRVPGRCWANANIVWDKGATAYKCEGVTNRNTKHKRRVVTLRGTSRELPRNQTFPLASPKISFRHQALPMGELSAPLTERANHITKRICFDILKKQICFLKRSDTQVVSLQNNVYFSHKAEK